MSEAILERLKVFREPVAAWDRFSLRTRKEIVRAVAKRLTTHPDLDGYFVVADLQDGGRAAAKVKTVRRRKIYPVPEEVLALFGEEIGANTSIRSIAGCSGTTHEATVSRLGSAIEDSGDRDMGGTASCPEDVKSR